MQGIRKIKHEDVEAIKKVIDAVALFPSELLDGMMADYFQNEMTEDIWITKEIDGVPVAVAYFAPEKLTNGTYNLYLIAIHNAYQGMGIGKQIMGYVEKYLKELGQRILIVETSGLPQFEMTRDFYIQCGYNKEAVIRDFYNEGEDKIVYWKKL
jgi:ribosomal protein S18 acetylase RimI-like enzyme